MKDNRKKASISAVINDIKPYIHKNLFFSYSMRAEHIPIVKKILLTRYKNVKLIECIENSKPVLKIYVHHLIGSDEKTITITNRKIKRKQNDLSWIDRLEELDAILDD